MRSLRPTFLLLASLALALLAPRLAAAESAYLGLRAEVADDGLRVTETWPDGPAAAAGLAVGDVVREFGGTKVRTLAALGRALAERRPGEVVVLLVRRGERSSTVEVRLGRRGEQPGAATAVAPAPSAKGAAKEEAPPTARPAGPPPYIGVEVSEDRRGLRIEAVRDDSPAARAKLEVGDVLHRFGGAAVTTLDDLASALAPRRAGDRVEVAVERGGETVALALVLGSRGRPAVAAAPDGGEEAVLAPAKGGLRVETAGTLSGARLEAGDLVTHVGEDAVDTRAALDRRIAAAGDGAALTVRRGDRTMKLALTVAAKAPTPGAAPVAATEAPARPARGRGQGEGRRERRRDLGAEMAPSKRGLKVQSVRVGSPAERVGLAVGDEVLQVDDTMTPTRDDFDRAVRAADGPVTLTVLRGGERKELRLEPRGRRGAGERRGPPAGAAADESAPAERGVGITFSDDEDRVRIAAVRVGGPAERAGLRAGDVVTHLDGAPVEEVSAFESALEAAANAVVGRRVVRVDRRGTRLDLPLDVPPADGARPADRPRRRATERAPSEVVRAFGATGRSGVVLTEVEPGGVAERFGLRSGDVVIAVDGAAVGGADALRRRIEGGRPRALTVVRDGNETEVVLRGRPAGDGANADAAAARPWIGVELTPTPAGLEVSAVRPNSPAARAGIRVGDRLTALGGRPVSSGEALAAAIGRHRPGDRIELTVARDGRSLALPVVLGRRDG